jgi:hypothetical protein
MKKVRVNYSFWRTIKAKGGRWNEKVDIGSNSDDGSDGLWQENT